MKDKYSKEYCKKITSKYKFKSDFIKKEWNIYMFAYRRNYLDEICSHMIIKNNNQKRMIYRFIFPDNYCYVGLTYNIIKRKENHLKYDQNSPVFIHIKETNLSPKLEYLTEYINVNESTNMEKYWMNKSEEDGFILLNRSKFNSIGGCNEIWNYQRCLEESKKYNTISDLRNNNISVYNKIIKNKWKGELFSHMKRPKNYNCSTLTKDKCIEISKKYNTIKDFSKNDNSTYQYAIKNKFIKEITKHMKRPINRKWTLEKCIEISRNYKNKKDFYNNERSVYTICSKNGWLKEVFNHLI